MPSYRYECSECKKIFERFEPSMKLLKHKTQCPVCGKVSNKIVSNIAGIIFKGKGFYETDYKRRK